MAPYLGTPLNNETIANFQKNEELPKNGQHPRKEHHQPLKSAPIEWDQPLEEAVSEVDTYIIENWKEGAEDSQARQARRTLGPFQFVQIKNTPSVKILTNYIPEGIKDPFLQAQASIKRAEEDLKLTRAQIRNLTFGSDGTYWRIQKRQAALRQALLDRAPLLHKVGAQFGTSYVGLTLGPKTLVLLPWFEQQDPSHITMRLAFALMHPEKDERLATAISSAMIDHSKLAHRRLPQRLLLSPNENFPPISPNFVELTLLSHTVANTPYGLEKLSQAIEAIAGFTKSTKELTGISPKDIRRFLEGQYPPSSQLRKGWKQGILPHFLNQLPTPELD